MEWRKDPVLREMEERANIRTRWLAALTVALIGLGFYAAGAHHRINRVVAALAVVAERPTVSTAALADAEWQEVNRRLNALESRPRSEPCTRVGCLVDHCGSRTTTTGRIRMDDVTTITTIPDARTVKQ